jgi:aminoglycoside phosphotransferase (APT) family kinase protein
VGHLAADEIAAPARERIAPAGRRVIGHGDWRQEHVRFVGDEPVVAFDWDSLCCGYEPALLGAVAHGFRADWSVAGRRQAPTLDEARAFKRDYEAARGQEFSAEERRLCGASFAYACAYTARCGYAGGGDAREQPGTFQNLLWSERANLLDL